MSTVLPLPKLALADGQRMGREDFHAAYSAAPAGVRAELVGGIVRMALPASLEHAYADSLAHTWLATYRVATPGVRTAANASFRIGADNELQPDLLMHVAAAGAAGAAGAILAAAPELVVEIAIASERLDLGDKRRAYAAAGVEEYLVVLPQRSELRWFRLDNGDLRPWLADADGLLRSAAFPGLWLHPGEFFAEDVPAMLATLQRGLASPEHAAFVAELRELRR